jgi:uronate dehydrogenase
MSASIPGKRILITGAAGYLGTVLRAGLSGRYPSLRLTDIAPLRDAPAAGEEYVQADLRKPADLEPAMREVNVVVHLGGCSLEAPWETILEANIAGTANVFEAARQAGVQRIVYASSHHVVGYYRRDRRVGPDEPPRPDSRYGVSKVFGEAVGRMYADKYGMSVICQRIGVARPEPQNVRGMAAYQSERDYVHLTERCIEAADVHFLIVYGISANTGVYWDNPGGDAIGYKPVDNGAAFSARVHARQKPEDEPPLERLFQGGWFCGMEFTGDPDRID